MSRQPRKIRAATERNESKDQMTNISTGRRCYIIVEVVSGTGQDLRSSCHNKRDQPHSKQGVTITVY